MVLLATKATDCLEAAKELLPLLFADSIVVSLQNGICEDALAGVFGRERMVGCVVGWGATMHGPAQIEVTSPGEFVIGNIDHRADQRLPLVQEMLSAVVPTRISNNIMGELYSKLIINSCINSLGVITGMNLGKLLAGAKIRKIFTALMREAMAVAAAMGIKVEPAGRRKTGLLPFPGWFEPLCNPEERRLDPHYRIQVPPHQVFEPAIPWRGGAEPRLITSTAYICDRGREHRVPTPVNDSVVSMIRQIEAGPRKISLENLNDPVFRDCRDSRVLNALRHQRYPHTSNMSNLCGETCSTPFGI